MDKAEWFRQYMKESASNYHETGELCADSVALASTVIASAFANGNRLLLAGNGTDASLCEIVASRFLSRFANKAPRKGWPAHNLVGSTNFLTGHSSRFGQEEVYSRLVETLGAHGDVLLCVESGESNDNLAWAMRKAEAKAMHKISLTGLSSKLSRMADVAIRVPLKDSPRISETHMVIQNAICFLVEGELLK
jgi:D-sedoheptulose 7-phosphate isomerase